MVVQAGKDMGVDKEAGVPFSLPPASLSSLPGSAQLRALLLLPLSDSLGLSYGSPSLIEVKG